MRLINVATFELEDFCPDQTPPYAILSHTWGSDEVTFDDLAQRRNYQHKSGNNKLVGTCRTAQSMGLEYAWIDTCCIDRTSSAELSESINSMFAWYRSAAACLVYLEDLPPPSPTKQDAYDELFWRGCRWFTRGWTLQELLAPGDVQFFDRDWIFRGKKAEQPVLGLISRISRIDEDILLDCDTMGEVSIAERISWAADRDTTRAEDRAYCLMGLFDINMPVLYGEGPKAFRRLQEEILKGIPDLSLFAWISASPHVAGFSGILADSPSEFSHIISSGHRWREPVPFDGELSLTNKGLSMLANFIPVDNGMILDLGDPGGAPHRYGILLQEVNRVLVRVGPDKLFTGASATETYCVVQPAGFENRQQRCPRAARPRTYRRDWSTNERSLSRRFTVKTVLDRRFIERKLKRRRSPSAHSSSKGIPLSRRLKAHRRQPAVLASELSNHDESFSEKDPDLYVGSSAAASLRTLPCPAQRTLRETNHSNHTLSCKSEPWEEISHGEANPAIRTPQDMGYLARNIAGMLGPESGDDLSIYEDEQQTRPVLEPGNPFLDIKDDLVQTARKMFEGQLEDGDRCLFILEDSSSPVDTRCQSPGTCSGMDAVSAGNAHVHQEATNIPFMSQPRLLACPYFSHDPTRHQKCLFVGDYRQFSDLLRHLWTQHRQLTYCPICFETFEQPSAWSDHIIRRTCIPQPPREIEGISEEKMHLLVRIARGTQSAEERWFAMWNAIFPYATARPDSSYVGGRLERVIGLVRRFWEREGRRIVSDFAERRGLLAWEMADEERSLEALHAMVLEELIALLVGSVEGGGYDNTPRDITAAPNQGIWTTFRGFWEGTQNHFLLHNHLHTD